jgi:hypothetical protein
MLEYLIVSDAVSPVVDGETARGVAGLARALGDRKHQVTILSIADAEAVARLPGMARRLRKVSASAGGSAVELPLFEGRVALSQAHLYVLGAPLVNRGQTASLLATAAAALARDGLLKPQVVVGWGETSAASLSAVGANLRLFVLPAGQAGRPLDEEERAALAASAAPDALSAQSLVALGDDAADAVLVPSPSSRDTLERDPALAARASDQPIVALRFGCDDAPYDPASDATLAALYSADNPAGKVECRRALARRGSLALGPRTLLVATGPLLAARGGRAILETLPRLARLDVAVAVAAGGDRALTDQAAVLAIEHPGKIAVIPDAGPSSDRALLAGADVVLLADLTDHSGRAAGIALRYGALPLAPEAGANADYLVDYDPASGTGCALLYAAPQPFEIEGVVRRALALRANAETWQDLVKWLLSAAPRWSDTAAHLDGLEPIETPAVITA